MPLIVGCCCWEYWLPRKTAAGYWCWLVAAGCESWLAKKKIGCGMPLVVCWCCCFGIPVSQEHWRRTLLLFESCCWGNLGGQKKIRLRKSVVFRWCRCWGNLVSQKNGRRALLSVGSCWWEFRLARQKNRLWNAACGLLVLLLRNPG